MTITCAALIPAVSAYAALFATCEVAYSTDRIPVLIAAAAPVTDANDATRLRWSQRFTRAPIMCDGEWARPLDDGPEVFIATCQNWREEVLP